MSRSLDELRALVWGGKAIAAPACLKGADDGTVNGQKDQAHEVEESDCKITVDGEHFIQ